MITCDTDFGDILSDREMIYDKMMWLNMKIEELNDGHNPDDSDLEIMVEFSRCILESLEKEYISGYINNKSFPTRQYGSLLYQRLYRIYSERVRQG